MKVRFCLVFVQQMHNEDMEAAQMEEHEYSSDEDYPIPSQWSNPGFGNPMVADSREQECEYRGNEVVQGSKYSSSGDVKDAVKRWAVSLGKEFRVARSNSNVRCGMCEGRLPMASSCLQGDIQVVLEGFYCCGAFLCFGRCVECP